MARRYSSPAIALHWLMALLIAGAFVLGLYMSELPLSPQKLKLYAYHKWIGVTVFLLLWLRLVARLVWPAPPLPDTLPRWQLVASKASHHALYLFMFAAPLSGWLMSSAGGFQTVWLGLVPLPDLLEKNRAVFEMLKEVHEALNYTFAALVMLHGAAALKHHFIDRDEVLRRMLPGMKS